MYGSDSAFSTLAYRLTNNAVVSACPTRHASFAAHMARETGVYDHILKVGVSVRIQARKNEVFFFAINTSHNGS